MTAWAAQRLGLANRLGEAVGAVVAVRDDADLHARNPIGFTSNSA